MKLDPQIDQLHAQLSRELENFSPGDRFYSVRTIMARFHANLRVVNGTLDRLEKEDLIRREPGCGLFCVAGEGDRRNTVLFIAPDWPSVEFQSFVDIFKRETSCRIISSYFDPEGDFLKNVPQTRIDAFFLFGDSRGYSLESLLRLKELGKPVVFWGYDYEDLPFSSITYHNMEGGMLACDYLISHGCRKLLCLRSEPQKHSIEERLEVFCTYARLHDVPVNRLDCATRPGEFATGAAYDTLNAYLDTHACDFDGLFIDSCYSARGVYAALTEHRLRVGVDVNVISFKGFGTLSCLQPDLTTVGCDPEMSSRMLYRQLNAVWDRKIPCFHIKVPMHINAKASVCQLRPPRKDAANQ